MVSLTLEGVRIGYDARSGTVERSRDDAWVSSAPMILNTSLISGFTALKLSGKLPKNVGKTRSYRFKYDSSDTCSITLDWE